MPEILFEVWDKNRLTDEFIGQINNLDLKLPLKYVHNWVEFNYKLLNNL
jgi:hypothetical protein